MKGRDGWLLLGAARGTAFGVQHSELGRSQFFSSLVLECLSDLFGCGSISFLFRVVRLAWSCDLDKSVVYVCLRSASYAILFGDCWPQHPKMSFIYTQNYAAWLVHVSNQRPFRGVSLYVLLVRRRWLLTFSTVHPPRGFLRTSRQPRARMKRGRAFARPGVFRCNATLAGLLSGAFGC